MEPIDKPRPIPIKHRFSVLFLEYGQLDVIDGAFVLVDEGGVRTHIPVGSVTCLMLEPGTRVSHAAVVLAARVGTLLVWVGEQGVRVYSAGQPGGARSDKLLYQARLALDDTLRLRVVRAMYAERFGEEAPQKRSVEQLRGIEGARVRATYKLLAQRYGFRWDGRQYDPDDWDAGTLENRCLSAANSCLYGVTEAAILAAGYAPAIGFIHTGKPRSFVFDIADLIKFDTTVPLAFQCAARLRKTPSQHPAERVVRRACRDLFRDRHIIRDLIPLIERMLAAGQIAPPGPAPDQVLPAIPNPESHGDDGHRN